LATRSNGTQCPVGVETGEWSASGQQQHVARHQLQRSVLTAAQPSGAGCDRVERGAAVLREVNAEAMSQMCWGDPKAFERAFSGVAA
jgi:hypothetical protein